MFGHASNHFELLRRNFRIILFMVSVLMSGIIVSSLFYQGLDNVQKGMSQNLFSDHPSKRFACEQSEFVWSREVAICYLSMNLDLHRIFCPEGYTSLALCDLRSAECHWIQFGRLENRSHTCEPQLLDCMTAGAPAEPTQSRPCILDGWDENIQKIVGVAPLQFPNIVKLKIKKLTLRVHEMCEQEVSLVKVEDWWDDVFNQLVNHKDWKDMCSGDFNSFSSFIEQMHASKLVFGFSQGVLNAHTIPLEKLFNWKTVTYDYDTLMRLAESIGVRFVYSPIHHGYGFRIANADPAKLWEEIETKLVAQLPAPTVNGGTIGINFGKKGVMHHRHFTSLYMAIKLRELVTTVKKEIGAHNVNICEIGGGSGYIAYFSKLLIDSEVLGTYVILDVIAAHMAQFITLSIDFDNVVSLTPEKTANSQIPDLFGSYNKPGSIKLIRADLFSQFAFEGCHIVVNMDSLPEMSYEVGRSYIKRISESSTVRYFFSQNQESRISSKFTSPEGTFNGRQFAVNEIAEEFRYKISLKSRYLAWMRMGYVEEVYCVHCT